MKINDKEIASVSALDTFKRYKYLIKRFADWEKCYGLMSPENNWAISEIKGHTLFPIWPAVEFAQNCIMDGWENFQPVEISLQRFEDEIEELIADNKFLINTFPVGSTTGFVVTLEEFKRDLDEELANYE